MSATNSIKDNKKNEDITWDLCVSQFSFYNSADEVETNIPLYRRAEAETAEAHCPVVPLARGRARFCLTREPSSFH